MSAKIPEVAGSPNFLSTSFKYNPLAHVRFLFIRFVQGLFSSAEPGFYKWSSDDDNTELYIGGEEVIDASVVEKKPAVHFIRGPVQFYSLGIDDRESYDFALDKKTKGVLLPGTMTINGVSSVSLESEHIAWVIAEHIWLLCDLIKKWGFFDVGRGIQVGSPSHAGSIVSDERGKEFFATPISVPYQFSRMSSFEPLNNDVIQRIDQLLRVRPAQVVNSLGAPARTHEVPIGAQYAFPPSFAPEARDLNTPLIVKQPHPLNPSQMVCVRTVRPNRAGANLHLSRAAIPISRTCVEQSSVQAPAFKQKG